MPAQVNQRSVRQPGGAAVGGAAATLRGLRLLGGAGRGPARAVVARGPPACAGAPLEAAGRRRPYRALRHSAPKWPAWLHFLT